MVIGFVWPEPDTTAAGARMVQLLEIFHQANYDITFASSAAVSEHSVDLKRWNVNLQFIRLNSASFDVFVKTLKPDVVMFDRYLTEEQYGWRVAEQCPDALRIVDTEDLHSLRHVREQCLKKGVPFTTNAWLQNDKTKREIASLYRSDLSLIISSYETELLQNTIGIDKCLLLHLPFLIDKITDNNIDSWPLFEERKDFICIGNGMHSPNVDAIVWLKKEIWPLIRKEIPQANLHIYGAYLPEHIKQMHQPKQGFLIYGWVHDKEEVFMNARVNLAPLRFGAGIKGKLIDAMQAGTPSVTTPIGAEGMHGSMEWSGSIALNVKDFARSAITLYRYKEKWKKAQKNGVAIINQLYDKEALTTLFLKRLTYLEKNLKTHRIHNFTGAMLQQQTMASTKYMSKWIEEKNKKTV
ncbi:glycosyltransferase [Maribacter thermophilus]|uniref:glycosyltransferase n=1 Tax=Maribacter thermophilus TaxID=1197874 RepID=UPI000AEC1AFA|nr:glycosyltransferase [Maribacter thermophilus]